MLVKFQVWIQTAVIYIAVALLPSIMGIRYMKIMLMQTLQTHGDIYLPDCFSIVTIIQITGATVFSEEFERADSVY